MRLEKGRGNLTKASKFNSRGFWPWTQDSILTSGLFSYKFSSVITILSTCYFLFSMPDKVATASSHQNRGQSNKTGASRKVPTVQLTVVNKRS